ncbi:MAG: hypothetical protein IZT59_02750, partial [Verrucomicrobia bacterium]|nr:hypothetical protein [Verrucomicrobiota bacterium]
MPKTTEIYCPECDSSIEVEDEHIGAKGKCPDCDHKFIIEKPAKAKEEKKPKEEAKKMLVAGCPKCAFELQVSREMEGRKGKCPKCEHRFVIEFNDSDTKKPDNQEDTEKEQEVVVQLKQKVGKRRKVDATAKMKQASEEELDALDSEKEDPEKGSATFLLLALVTVILLGSIIWFLIPSSDKNTENGKREDTTSNTRKAPEDPSSRGGINPFDDIKNDPETGALTKVHITPSKSDLPAYDLSPLAKSSKWLMLHVNHRPFGDDKLATLEPGLERIVWANLNDTQISDNAMEFVCRMQELDRLQVRGTGVSDAGLSLLSALSKLKVLNLSKCANITDACIPYIEAIPS